MTLLPPQFYPVFSGSLRDKWKSLALTLAPDQLESPANYLTLNFLKYSQPLNNVESRSTNPLHS